MVNKISKEHELYPHMQKWLEQYLNDKYKLEHCKIIVLDCHSQYLDVVLNKYDIIKYYPEIVGLKIEIDVLGMVIWNNKAKLYFIEAKKTPLNLQNLGQLIVYCKLCNPEEAFLLSSAGTGTLDHVISNLHREDLLEYGNRKNIQKIKIARWDVSKNGIDHLSLIPKL